jgi:hypothetical protein
MRSTALPSTTTARKLGFRGIAADPHEAQVIMSYTCLAEGVAASRDTISPAR